MKLELQELMLSVVTNLSRKSRKVLLELLYYTVLMLID